MQQIIRYRRRIEDTHQVEASWLKSIEGRTRKREFGQVHYNTRAYNLRVLQTDIIDSAIRTDRIHRRNPTAFWQYSHLKEWLCLPVCGKCECTLLSSPQTRGKDCNTAIFGLPERRKTSPSWLFSNSQRPCRHGIYTDSTTPCNTIIFSETAGSIS